MPRTPVNPPSNPDLDAMLAKALSKETAAVPADSNVSFSATGERDAVFAQVGEALAAKREGRPARFAPVTAAFRPATVKRPAFAPSASGSHRRTDPPARRTLSPTRKSTGSCTTTSSPAPALPVCGVITGCNSTRLWGMSSSERLRRCLNRAGIAGGVSS